MKFIVGIKANVQRIFSQFGYRLSRVDAEDLRYLGTSHDLAAPLPEGAEAYLRYDNPRLNALRECYSRCSLPMCQHTYWAERYGQQNMDLRYFRGDNAYVWQYRNLRAHARLKYYLYAQYIREFDRRGLLGHLKEDGSFGCWTFLYHGLPAISRDLLDSINELYFLDRHWRLYERKEFSVLDIGAGYGRLAHRMVEGVPGLAKYYCVDAVPESTFLCEYYLGFLQANEKAEVIPVDEIETRLPIDGIDLAVNIHSFSEMSFGAIGGWLDLLARLGVPTLLIVPNDSNQLLSIEADGSRRDFLPLIESSGYQLKVCEPILSDPNLQELTGVTDHFFYFARKGRA